MIPEISRAIAIIQNSPYAQIRDPLGVRSSRWLREYETATEMSEELIGELKIAQESILEPWGYLRVSNYLQFPNAVWLEKPKKIATLLGDITLVELGTENDTTLIGRYQKSSTHYSEITAMSLDAFMAQNQSPVEWL